MRRALHLLAAAALLGGCGHLWIRTNEAEARIYADGLYVGKGQAELPRRMGPPASMEITVRGESASVRRTIRREFTLATFALGVYSYLTGFLWAWQYPQEVFVTLPARAVGGWDDAPSAWDAPPSGWDAPPDEGAPRR